MSLEPNYDVLNACVEERQKRISDVIIQIDQLLVRGITKSSVTAKSELTNDDVKEIVKNYQDSGWDIIESRHGGRYFWYELQLHTKKSNIVWQQIKRFLLI